MNTLVFLLLLVPSGHAYSSSLLVPLSLRSSSGASSLLTPFSLSSYSRRNPPRSYRYHEEKPRYVLDVGCGHGKSTRDLVLDKTICESDTVVIGMDKKKSCIVSAQRDYPSLLFVARDALRTHFFDDSFHHIQIRLSLLEFHEISRVLVDEMYRILHPEGRLEIIDYAPDHSFLAEIAELPEPYRSRLYPQWVFHDPYENYRTFRKKFYSLDLPAVDPETSLVHTTLYK